ncbi:hypothetical protein [Caldilinea sp.]|uniref:hypothetical protein n=1 Tax=Caldilinea sp. TaxID=2293560 RepID=UPI0021DE7CD8|nr:hypothetical protein [Caldilinea sp.]GIV73511.1 MAG: hypothetical protein KatS3mg049_2067 [Caldilinea sp.]
MPRNGVSSDWVAEREDEIARFITARDHLDRLQRLMELLHSRRMITDAYYQDVRDSLDYIAAMLLVGKRNTARLRNAKP